MTTLRHLTKPELTLAISGFATRNGFSRRTVRTVSELKKRAMYEFMAEPKYITYRDVSTVMMVAGNEKDHPTIIHEGKRKKWVGFGWIEERSAVWRDYLELPVVK